MAKDISCYIGFGPPERRKRSMKSTLNIPMTVLSWELKKSSWRRKGEDDEDLDDDGRTRWKGLYAEMVVNLEGADFTVCTGAIEIMDELVRMVGRGERVPEDTMHSFNSWKAHAMLGHSYHTIRRIRKCLQPIQSCLPTWHKRNASRS